MTYVARTATVLVTGWPSFLHGEATAGDVLAMEAVVQALGSAHVFCEAAWSPVLRPGELTLEGADPGRYTHVVFACGPLHGRQLEELHGRYAQCRRIAVGVLIIDPADPAARGFHVVLPRDGDGAAAHRDLAAQVCVPRLPVVGVIMAPSQPEYAQRRRHDQVAAELAAWLAGQDCARLPLDTRLDSRDWRHAATPAQLESVLVRLDMVVTTRLHGLVLSLKNGVPVLAVDPVADGAKVTGQARAWHWPAVITPTGRETARHRVLDSAELDRQWHWCLSDEAVAQARAAAAAAPPRTLTADLLWRLYK